MQSLRWKTVAVLTAGLSLVAGFIVLGPMLTGASPSSPQGASAPTLQDYVRSGEIRRLDSTASIKDLLPYESISLERTPCYGTCPVYTVTFHRDGQAILSTVNSSDEGVRTYRGKIAPTDFVRLTQLVGLAKAAADESAYAGRWLHDSSAIVRAKSADGTWVVSDYGRVSPPEVWSLALILHVFRENAEWIEQPVADGELCVDVERLRRLS